MTDKFIDCGSRKHVLDLVSDATRFHRTINDALSATGFALAESAALRPCGRAGEEWVETDVETYLSPNSHGDSYPSIPEEWWITYQAARSRRPTWDLIARLRSTSGEPGVLLVEAKAHVTELSKADRKSPPYPGSRRSLANDAQIRRNLGECEAFLNEAHRGLAGRFVLSTSSHYQLANRLAYAVKLASLGRHVVLLYLGFLGDEYFEDRFRDEGQWHRAMGGYLEGVVPQSFPSTHLRFEGGGSLQMIVKSAQVVDSSSRPLRQKPVAPAASKRQYRPIDPSLSLHQILRSTNQLSFMREHAEALSSNLDQMLMATEACAPEGRQKRKQNYELLRVEKPDSAVRERLLEKLLWSKWRPEQFSTHGEPFFGGVCNFIQSYQVPLQGSWDDEGWGKVDLLGASARALPVVIELKQEDALDTPLRMLTEALAYACALRKAWSAGPLRQEWVEALRLQAGPVLPQALDSIPLLLVAPSAYWSRKIGTTNKHTNGKVRDNAWRPFQDLLESCRERGYPTYLLRFDIIDVPSVGGVSVSNLTEVRLPI